MMRPQGPALLQRQDLQRHPGGRHRTHWSSAGWEQGTVAELSCSQRLGPMAEGLTGPGWGPKEGFCPRRGLANHLVGKRLRWECGRDQGPDNSIRTLTSGLKETRCALGEAGHTPGQMSV